MGKIKRNLIEYNGINACIIRNKKNFNQINLEDNFCIPTQKPDIEDINRIWVEAKIKDYDIVKTPIGVSLEGQKMTGFKLLACGELKLKVEYVTCDSVQSVHTAHKIVPFCAYAVLPDGVNENTRMVPSIIIEDILAEQVNERCIYNNITMMLIVDIC